MNLFQELRQKVKAFFTYYIKHRIHRKQYAEIRKLGEENARLKMKVKRILLAYGDQVGDEMADGKLWMEYQEIRMHDKMLLDFNDVVWFGNAKAVNLSDRDSAKQNGLAITEEIVMNQREFSRMMSEAKATILPPPEHPLSEKYIAGADPISSGKNSLGVDPFQSFITSPQPFHPYSDRFMGITYSEPKPKMNFKPDSAFEMNFGRDFETNEDKL